MERTLDQLVMFPEIKSGTHRGIELGRCETGSAGQIFLSLALVPALNPFPMIRIAITPAAYDALIATLPEGAPLWPRLWRH